MSETKNTLAMLRNHPPYNFVLLNPRKSKEINVLAYSNTIKKAQMKIDQISRHIETKIPCNVFKKKTQEGFETILDLIPCF